MKKILLFGGGGHCRSLIDVIEQEGVFSIAGIIDQKERIGESVLGYKIIGCDDDLSILFKSVQYAIVSVGQIQTPDVRIKLFNELKNIGFTIPRIISPRAYISKHASIEEGTVVFHDALINANVRIGENCIINTKALVEHDSVIEANCHISTGAIVNGGSIVKQGTFFGSNAVSKEMIVIEERSFIKAGSVSR